MRYRVKGINPWSRGFAMVEIERGLTGKVGSKRTGCPKLKFVLVTRFKVSVGLITGELLIFNLFHYCHI